MRNWNGASPNSTAASSGTRMLNSTVPVPRPSGRPNGFSSMTKQRRASRSTPRSRTYSAGSSPTAPRISSKNAETSAATSSLAATSCGKCAPEKYCVSPVSLLS
eukprot:Amastigsp_a677136_3.p3 type:complete len:104 gc:universal Amastigsp_a677136_3:488-177(-)